MSARTHMTGRGAPRIVMAVAGTSETFPRKRLTYGLADSGWQQRRVYFLAFSNRLRGQPVSALTARLASLCNRR